MDYDKLEQAHQVAGVIVEEVLLNLMNCEPVGIAWFELTAEDQKHIGQLCKMWVTEILAKEY